jgi:hypothetical protein
MTFGVVFRGATRGGRDASIRFPTQEIFVFVLVIHVVERTFEAIRTGNGLGAWLMGKNMTSRNLILLGSDADDRTPRCKPRFRERCWIVSTR